MHQLLHGIRRSFLTACGGLLSNCLPLLPFDGVEQEAEEAVNTDLQPFGYGDLLPTTGDEDAADETYLRPAYKVGHKEQRDASQPEANGADNGDLQPPLHGGQDDEEAGLNLQKAPIDGQQQEEGALLPMKGDDDKEVGKSLLNLTKMGGGFQAGRISNDGKNLPTEGLAESHPHQFPPWVMPIPRPRVKMKANICMYTTPAHSWQHDGWASTIYYPHYELMCMGFQPSSTSTVFYPGEYGHDGNPQQPHHVPYSFILAINFTSREFLSAFDIPNSPSFMDSAANEDNTSLLLNLHILRGSVHAEYDDIEFFLIPLRGSISVQWNDEDFNEDVAALKMKTKRRMMVLRLLYLMKDLLDPG